MRKSLVAQVFVEKTTISFDKSFDYCIPFDMYDKVFVGQRVLVPFGRANKKRQAVVYNVIERELSDVAVIKPISSIIDKEPLVTEEMIKLSEFIKEHTFCTFFEAFKLMIPLGINVNIISSFVLCKEFEEINLDELSDDEKLVVKSLFNAKGPLKQSRLLEIIGSDNEKFFDNLVSKEIIEKEENTIRRVGDASIKMVRTTENFENIEVKLTQKQKSVVDFLADCKSASIKELCYFTGVTQAVVTNLVKKNILELFETEVYRTPYDSYVEVDKKEIVLAKEQQIAFDSIMNDIEHCEKGCAGLLYGVTGSGKTQVYLKTIDEVLNKGKSVIVMVPEIALTPQTMNIFRNRYGNQIAIFHSAMSLGQRTDEWKRVKNGDAKIAIGTRSAIFAPFKNLGLIIMDEEQEHTYKSESSPRFHARDVAKFRCSYNNCMFLMASATPSVETFSLAKMGAISLYTMKSRYGNVSLPIVKKVNMKEQYKKGNFGIFSDELTDALSKTFEDKKQAIILLNRRGYQVLVTCCNCGQVRQCPNCSISLTYHTANNRMMCHYCGYSEEFNEKCGNCGEKNIRLSGFGTQKAQEELATIFPSARILRMDADTTMTRFSHEKNLNAFANGDYDVMIGTQMVAKGLDFPNVTLVGVINADQSLFGNDYRAYEKTFSLLTQVIGRSGREQDGIAVIQTISPENEIIELSANQDYERFYHTEILSRKILKYPPYCDLCLIGFSGVSKEYTYNFAVSFFDKLKIRVSNEYKDLKIIVLGPSPCNVPKVNNKYRFRLIVKCKNNKRLRSLINNLLIDCSKTGKYKNISVFADINPENMI